MASPKTAKLQQWFIKMLQSHCEGKSKARASLGQWHDGFNADLEAKMHNKGVAEVSSTKRKSQQVWIIQYF